MALFGRPAGPTPSTDELRDLDLDRLSRLAMSLTGNRIDAEDLLQDTLVAVLAGWSKVAASENARAYTSRIMVNRFLTGTRRRAAREIVSDLTAHTGPVVADPAEAYIARHDLLRLVAALPPRARAVVVLRYLGDMSVSQVGEMLDMREGTVRASCSRAITAIRAGLAPDEQDQMGDRAREHLGRYSPPTGAVADGITR